MALRGSAGRIAALLAAGCLGLSGLGAAPAPAVPAKAAAKARPDVARLKALVEAGERSAQDKDWDGATTRADEA